MFCMVFSRACSFSFWFYGFRELKRGNSINLCAQRSQPSVLNRGVAANGTFALGDFSGEVGQKWLRRSIRIQ